MSGNLSLIEALKALELQALEAVGAATDAGGLEALRILYLGRKDGQISGILRGLGSLGPEERPAVGAEANRVKERVQQALEARKEALAGVGTGKGQELDLSLPGSMGWRGGAIR